MVMVYLRTGFRTSGDACAKDVMLCYLYKGGIVVVAVIMVS